MEKSLENISMQDYQTDENDNISLGKQSEPLDVRHPIQQGANQVHTLTDDFAEDFLLCKEPKLDPEKCFFASPYLLEFLENQRLLLSLHRHQQKKALHNLFCHEQNVGPIATRSLLGVLDSEPDICKQRLPSASHVLYKSPSPSPTSAPSRNPSPFPVSSFSRTTPHPPSDVLSSNTSTRIRIQPSVSTTVPLLSFSPHLFSTPVSTPPAPSSASSPIMSSLLADSDSSMQTFRDQNASPPNLPNVPSCPNVNPNANLPSPKKRHLTPPTPSPSLPTDAQCNLGAREKVEHVIPEKYTKETSGFKSIVQPQQLDTSENLGDQKKMADGRKLKPLIPDEATPSTSCFKKPYPKIIRSPRKSTITEMLSHLVDLSKKYGLPIKTVLEGISLDQSGSHELKTGMYTVEEKMHLEAKAEKKTCLLAKVEPMTHQQASVEPTSHLHASVETTTPLQTKDEEKAILFEKSHKLKGGPYKNID